MAVNYLSKRDLAADVVDQIRKTGRKAMLAQADVADNNSCVSILGVRR